MAPRKRSPAPPDHARPEATIGSAPTGLDAPPPGYGPRPAPGRRRRGLPWLVGALVLLGLVVVGGPFVFFHLGGSSPGRLALPPVDGVHGPVRAGPVSGTWTVSSGSQAGYRVQEILFGQHHTAVGRTSKVSGGMVISGTVVTAADFTVDLASVQTDQAGRNEQFHGQLLETYAYPDATFRLTRAIDFARVPAAGQHLAAAGTGLLTLRGLTRPVAVSLQAERIGRTIEVTGAIPITFSAYHIPNPSFAIAQIGDTGLVEVLLHLVPARR